MSIKKLILQLFARKANRSSIRLDDIQRVLIYRHARIGDTICLYPLIRELKKSRPNIQIDIYAGKDNSFMFHDLPEIDNVYRKYKKSQPLKTFLDLVKARRNKYDLVIDTLEIKFGKIIALTFIRPKWIIGIHGVETRYGLRHKDLNMYDGLYERETNHISQNLLGMLKLIGIKDFDDQMGFPLSEKSIAFAEQFTAPYRDYTIVGLNTDATDLERMISDQDMISVYNELIKKIDNLIVLLFCTPDKYLHFSELKKQHNMSKLILEQGTKGFFDAAAMVKFVDVMISTDTSFIHIASALDTPTVGIYQNEISHIKYWGPRSSLHTVITPELPGRTTRGFKPAEVANAASNLLHEKRLQSAARDQV